MGLAHGNAVQGGQGLTGANVVAQMGSHRRDAPFDARRDAGEPFLVGLDRRGHHDRVIEGLGTYLLDLDTRAFCLLRRERQFLVFGMLVLLLAGVIAMLVALGAMLILRAAFAAGAKRKRQGQYDRQRRKAQGQP